MYILDVTNPITLGLLTIATALLIFLGKEVKKPYIPAIPLVFFLLLVLIHSMQFANIPEINFEEVKSVLLGCITVDLVLVFITFFGYLWVDDIAAKFYKKKSIDSSLDWFWNNV